MSYDNVKVNINHDENKDNKIYTSLLNNNKCIICKDEKPHLINCNSFYSCSCKLCYSCLQLQLNKYLQPYDIVWQGEDDKEFYIDDNDDITSLILPQIKDSIKELLIIRNKKSTNIVLYSNIDSTIEDDNQLCLFSDTAIQLLHNNSDYWIIL